ncbi:MAG: AfsR/SARP family transcriptional regulator [Actinocatenispora sp.]
MQFTLLGPLQVIHSGKAITPSAPKVRQVLALLLLRSNQMVGMDSVIEELWNGHPPRSAVTTAQTYIYQLRKAFAATSTDSDAESLLGTSSPGYCLSIEDDQLDYRRFDRLVLQSQDEQAAGRTGRAAELVEQALDMWTGRALSNVYCGPMLTSYAAHLEEKRMAALELHIQLDMQLGRHRKLIAELRSLVAAHPFNEWIHAQLILALSKAGRRNEALQSYHSVRAMLNAELGLDPSAELQRVHHEILTDSGPRAEQAPARFPVRPTVSLA